MFAKLLPEQGSAPRAEQMSGTMAPRHEKPASNPENGAQRTLAPQGICWGHYEVAFGAFVAVSVLNLWLQKWIGYQAIALVYLLAVVLLALFLGRGPILFSAALTAIGWSFIFAPPPYSFHIAGSYDKMMLVTYFVVALTVGQLTARLRAQREAEIKAKLLVESERLGRTLLNSVSHEFRTPIATIIGAAEGLRATAGLSVVQEKLAAEIESAGARLNRVVQNLLSASRLQSGQVQPNPDWCDVSDLLRTALRDVENLTAGHPIEVRKGPNLPLVKLDFVLMEQALGNLLTNAAIHTPPETPIEVGARIEGTDLVLEVSDRGPGLPADQLERVFDLFHRAPNAKPGGTGLGLAIVKGFIEAQGGRVLAANRPCGGALFAIRMPATDTPELPEETL
jgi:two-component system sensor histidine kinase KdpD